MKRFIVEQRGYVQLGAGRRFLVEAPDHFNEDRVEEQLKDVDLPEDQGMEWSDEHERKWTCFDVEVEETEVYDPETTLGADEIEGLPVVTLTDVINAEATEGRA
jgi:hypothetical protein